MWIILLLTSTQTNRLLIVNNDFPLVLLLMCLCYSWINRSYSSFFLCRVSHYSTYTVWLFFLLKAITLLKFTDALSNLWELFFLECLVLFFSVVFDDDDVFSAHVFVQIKTFSKYQRVPLSQFTVTFITLTLNLIWFHNGFKPTIKQFSLFI